MDRERFQAWYGFGRGAFYGGMGLVWFCAVSAFRGFAMKKYSNYAINGLFILFLSLSGPSAFASPVTFTITEQGGLTGSFTFFDIPRRYKKSYWGGTQYAPDLSTGIWSGETVNFYPGGGFYSTKGDVLDRVSSWWPVHPQLRLAIAGSNSAPIFNVGTYEGYNYINLQRSTLIIEGGPLGPLGPAAPAPLVGGGLLSALAALLGLGLTRFGRRRGVLA